MRVNCLLLGFACAGLLLAPGGVRADERLARVASWKPVGGPPACGQRIEALLRNSDYRLVDESFPREKLDLLIVTQPNCRQRQDRKFYCSAKVQVGSPAGQAFTLQGDGSSLGSWPMALDEACQVVADQLASQLEGIQRGVPPKRPPGCKSPGAPG